MKIPVDRLTATPRSFSFEGDSAWWQSLMPPEEGLPQELDEPFRVSLQAHLMGDAVYLEGELEGSLALECSRCLARYRHALREPFRLVLEPAGTRSPADPEGAAALERDGVCLRDELETGWFRGKEIRLGSHFLELIALALPVKPLCSEDCAGLCPGCGARRADGECGCEQVEPKSPFAVLARLRTGLTGGES